MKENLSERFLCINKLICSICKHSYGMHKDNGGKEMGCAINLFKSNIPLCLCQEYITSDNLKFLEQKYQESKA